MSTPLHVGSTAKDVGLAPPRRESINHLLLPATWRTPGKRVALPEDDLGGFLAHDLTATRLNSIHEHLWMMGRMLPPRPLHAQLLMSREIVITEQIELHLVWTKGKIFIKPLPRYLLDEAFSRAYIDSEPKLASCARGLFHSYTALVASESDFRIASKVGLLPEAVDWPEWCEIVRRFVEEHSASDRGIYGEIDPRYLYGEIDPRYLYGELRLSRLNMIHRWLRGSLLYAYSPETSLSLYSDFFTSHFGHLTAALVYVAIVLAAMQVGLEDDLLENGQAFQQACYGFSIFAIVAPLAFSAAVLVVFAFTFLSHWIRTKRDQAKRLKDMGIRPNV